MKMKKVKSSNKTMLQRHDGGRFSCCLSLETDSILLMKLRGIFGVSSDKDLSKEICKLLLKFAREEEQKDIDRRINANHTTLRSTSDEIP